MRYRKYKILLKCKTPRYTGRGEGKGGAELIRNSPEEVAAPRARLACAVLVVWTGAWLPARGQVVIAQSQRARSYSVERNAGKPFPFPLLLHNKLLSNALRILNESSHLQNAQHFLRGSQRVGCEMPVFSRGRKRLTRETCTD